MRSVVGFVIRNVFGFSVALMILSLGHRAEAQGQVLSFNEVSPTENPILGQVVCADTTGFRFFSDHFHLTGVAFAQDYTYNGTTHIGYESGRGFPITMQRVGGGTFSLLSLDAAEFYAVPVADRPDAQILTITGIQQGGGTVSHTINLDGVRDGPNGAVDFQHFVLPNTFVNLTSVVFTGLRAGNASGGVAVDNVEYQLAAPEVLAPCVAIPLPPDTPTVSLVSPAAGNVAGTVLVAASAADNIGITSVQFKLDGVDLGPADTIAPYSVSWDTTLGPDGAHTLTAEARDAANNLTTASVVVTVQNLPGGPTTPHYVELDGVDDYLQVADANSLSFGTGTADTPLTIETWFRPDAMVRHQLVGKWVDGSNAEYRLHLASGVIRLDLRDNSAGAMVSAYTTSSQGALVGTWHHLAVTYDGRGGATAATGITLYIDGVAVPLTRINAPGYVAMENLSAPLQIGRESPSWKQYDGALDELRLWNVARSVSEIQSFMTTELTGSEAGLVAYWRFDEGTGSTVTDDSLGNHTASLLNGLAWLPGGPMDAGAPDVTPPAITNVVLSNLTTSTVTITFNTSEATTAWVSYATTPVCPCTDVYGATVGTAHSVVLTGLTADTVYHFTVRATDAAANLQVGPPQTFQTLAGVSDTTPPTVSLVSPAAGNVAGTVLVAASAADNIGITSVQFKLDGVDLGPADTIAPYSVSWDTTLGPDGAHTLTAEARDAANNLTTASVVVTVQNLPGGPTTPHYVELDGVDDYLQVADANSLSFGTGTADTPLTIETWFRPDAMVRHQLVGKWVDGSNAEYRLHLASGVIRLDLRDNSAGAMVSAYTTSSQGALVGTWHHLAVTYDGRGGATAATGITLYIDGVAVPLTRINAPGYVAMENLSAPLQIGRESPSWKQYDGALDELRLWNVARSVSEIQSFMTTELTGSEAGLVAYWRFDEGTGSTVTDDSLGNHTASLLNGLAWLPGGPMDAGAPDVTPPAITNVVLSNLTTSTVTITFNTSEATTAWVSYATTPVCPCTDVYGATVGTAHSVVLTGLTADTVYHFTVRATDAAANLQVGPPQTFQTLAGVSDTTPPTVSLVSPAAGNVAGTVLVAASAADNIGITSVQFKLDGVDLGPADTIAPYSVSWDTTLGPDGAHTLTAEARDAANNLTTASVVVTVQNLPGGPTTPHYVELDGVDDYLQVADANSLSFGTGTADTPLTIETWFRPDAMVRHQLVGKWVDGSNAEYRLHLASGVIRLDLRDNSAGAMVSAYTTSSQGALVGTWHHLAVTYDGRGGATAATGITLYIDGVAVPLTRINAPGYVAMENLSAPLQIGRESPSWKQYDGALDELRLWNVARSVSEIQSFMTTELTGSEAGLVAYWRFDEGTGSTVTDDSLGNHTASLLNGLAWLPGGPLHP